MNIVLKYDDRSYGHRFIGYGYRVEVRRQSGDQSVAVDLKRPSIRASKSGVIERFVNKFARIDLTPDEARHLANALLEHFERGQDVAITLPVPEFEPWDPIE